MTSPLNPALAAFLTSHISIHFAATGTNGMATLVRGLGCRIAPEAPTRLRLLVSRPQAEPVLRRDVRTCSLRVLTSGGIR